MLPRSEKVRPLDCIVNYIICCDRPMTQIDNIIKLDQFLKWVGVAPTGGQAKLMILDGNVLVNGEIETRRGRKLVTGDRVTVGNETFTVELDNP